MDEVAKLPSAQSPSQYNPRRLSMMLYVFLKEAWSLIHDETQQVKVAFESYDIGPIDIFLRSACGSGSGSQKRFFSIYRHPSASLSYFIAVVDCDCDWPLHSKVTIGSGLPPCN